MGKHVPLRSILLELDEDSGVELKVLLADYETSAMEIST